MNTLVIIGAIVGGMVVFVAVVLVMVAYVGMFRDALRHNKTTSHYGQDQNKKDDKQ